MPENVQFGAVSMRALPFPLGFSNENANIYRKSLHEHQKEHSTILEEMRLNKRLLSDDVKSERDAHRKLLHKTFFAYSEMRIAFYEQFYENQSETEDDAEEQCGEERERNQSGNSAGISASIGKTISTDDQNELTNSQSAQNQNMHHQTQEDDRQRLSDFMAFDPMVLDEALTFAVYRTDKNQLSENMSSHNESLGARTFSQSENPQVSQGFASWNGGIQTEMLRQIDQDSEIPESEENMAQNEEQVVHITIPQYDMIHSQNYPNHQIVHHIPEYQQQRRETFVDSLSDTVIEQQPPLDFATPQIASRMWTPFGDIEIINDPAVVPIENPEVMIENHIVPTGEVQQLSDVPPVEVPRSVELLNQLSQLGSFQITTEQWAALEKVIEGEVQRRLGRNSETPSLAELMQQPFDLHMSVPGNHHQQHGANRKFPQTTSAAMTLHQPPRGTTISQTGQLLGNVGICTDRLSSPRSFDAVGLLEPAVSEHEVLRTFKTEPVHYDITGDETEDDVQVKRRRTQTDQHQSQAIKEEQ